MSRQIFIVTEAYQAITTAIPIFITIKKVGTGNIYFNESNANNNEALVLNATNKNEQVEMTKNQILYVKADSVGFELIIDDT